MKEELPPNEGQDNTERGRSTLSGLLSGVKDVFQSNKPVVTKIQEILPLEAAPQYNLLLENEALKTYLFRDLPANNAIIAQPAFCNPLDAYLVARCPLLWSRVNPLKAKVSTSAEKDEMTKLASISPFFYLKSLDPSKSGLEFDSFVVDAFLSDPAKNGTSYIERYFHDPQKKRELKKDYEDFVRNCAEFLPALVQGDLLCVLMSAKPLQNGVRPIRDAILSREDIVVKFVVFQYAKRIERIIDRMQESFVELAVSPDKTLLKKISSTAKGASGQDAVFNREKKIFAKFVGLRFMRMFCQYLNDKFLFQIEEKRQQEYVNWASYAQHYIYQLILKTIKSDEGSAKPFLTTVDFFQTHFDNLLFGGANKETHILLDFTEQCDKAYKPDLQGFKDLVSEIKAEVGVKLLLAESNDARYLGTQEIFDGPKVPASLGRLLLSNASSEQLLLIASRYPNSGACFRANTERFFIPLLEMIAQRYRELDLVGIRKILAGCDRDVLLKLDPSHYATLIAINPDDCIAPIANYLQNSKNDPVYFTSILNYENITPELARLVLDEFNRAFITKICESLAMGRQNVGPSALVKLLLCQQREISSAILAFLKKNRAAIFPMFDVKFCNQGVIVMLESILVEYLERQDNDHDELIRHVSKYLRCRGVVESKRDTFFAICKNDPDVRAAVFTAVLKDHADGLLTQQRDWVLPLLRKIILAVDDQEWLKSGFGYVPKLLELDQSVAEALLVRKAIVEALEADNNLTQAHWLMMINLLLSNRGQNLLTSEVLKKELIVRLCMWVNEKNLLEQPAAAEKLFTNEVLGRLVLMQLKHPSRILLFNTATPKLVQQLFRLYDHDSVRGKLYEIMARCLEEITSKVFFELAFQRPKWLQYIVQSVASQGVLDNFIRLNHAEPWIDAIQACRFTQPDPFLQPRGLELEEPMHSSMTEVSHDEADDASEEDLPSPILHPLPPRDSASFFIPAAEVAPQPPSVATLEENRPKLFE